jgi:hypothetical protein
LFSGDTVYFIAIIKAHIGFMKWLLFHHRNKAGFPLNKRAKLSGWYKHSIVWMHFIRGKKTFGEILGDKA